MSKSHQLAWAAGFMDGDGHICIQNRKTKHKDKIYTGTYLRVGACQASLPPLEKLKQLFGGSIKPKNSGPNREGYNRKPQWVWALSTQEAANALEQMLPYLLHKKKVAELALEFQTTMSKTKQQLSEEVIAKRLQLQSEITSINSLS